MDSGNSGSLQSSSGGDEEYDSRAAAAAPIFIPPAPQPHPLMFDPLIISNYMQQQQQQLHNQNPNNYFHPNTSLSLPAGPTSLNPNPFTSSDPHPEPPPSVPDHAPPPETSARNPRKRSRASRRAPTTVLTTDTTNFRAMVQEFTGIPSPPFSHNNNSPKFLARARLDNLFGAAPYLRRPFAQKPQTTPFLASTSSTTNNNNNSDVVFKQIHNYQQNPILTSKFIFPNNISPAMASATSKPQINFDHHQFTAASLNPDLLPNLISSDQNNNNAYYKDRAQLIKPVVAVNGDNYHEFDHHVNTTSSNGHQENGGGGSRGGDQQGMVESWIYSSE